MRPSLPAPISQERDPLERQNELLKQAMAIYDRLTGMVLQGSDVSTITELFAELVGHTVVVLDPALQPRAQASPPGLDGASAGPVLNLSQAGWRADDAGAQQLLVTLDQERRPLRLPPLPQWGIAEGCIMAPISIGDTILGYLALAERADADDELDMLTVQHATTIYALTFMHEQATADMARRFKQDLFEGLLLGSFKDPIEAQERAVLLGYFPVLAYRLISVVPEGLADARGEGPANLAMRRRILDSVAELVERYAQQVITVARLHETVILVPDSGHGSRSRPDAVSDLVRSLPRLVQHRFPRIELTIAVSGLCRAADQLPGIFSQTRRAMEMGRRFGRRGQVIAYDQLGIYRLLFRVTDAADLRAFAEETLGSLVTYDRNHNSEFVHTLAVYLRRHGSPQQAARDLVVHVNTVSYRLQRIETITGLDLRNPDDRLVAQVALKILDALGPEQPVDP